MNNLIYQYWHGNLTKGTIASKNNIENYASKIGVNYLFEHNPNWVTNLGKYSRHYCQFKVIYDKSFDKYDNILFLDSDIYTVHNLDISIFDNFSHDIGVCEETWQPQNRLKMKDHHIGNKWDEKWCDLVYKIWGVHMPRTEENLPKVYNSGVVLYSRKGINKMRKSFMPFKKYISIFKDFPIFYTADQNYLHAMIFVCNLDLLELSTDWDSFVHGYYVDGVAKKVRALNDLRTSSTKFVHIQLPAADDFDVDTLWRITNLAPSEWHIPIPNYTEDWNIK